MKINPKIPKKLPIIDEAISSGKYMICPDARSGDPKVLEPQHNPERNDQIARWIPSQFSFQMPDGGIFFCDLLQNGDPSTPWTVTDTEPVTEEDF